MKENKETLKKYFETGDKPTQPQYADLIDSLAHIDDFLQVNSASLIKNGEPYDSDTHQWVQDNFGKMLLYADSYAAELYYYDYSSSDWNKLNNVKTINGQTGHIEINGDTIVITNPETKEEEILDDYLQKMFSSAIENIDIENGYLKLTTDTAPRQIIAQISLESIKRQMLLPEYTLSEITNNKIALLKDDEIVKEIDLTSYIDDTNLARLVSGSVDENGLATFTRDDDSVFTVDLSNLKSETSLQELTDVGNETNNGLIINTTGSDVTNVFNSDVLIKTDHKEEGIYIPHMIDVKREASDEDAIFYGGMHRAEYYGEEPIKEVFGKYNIGRITGEGSVTSLGGQINVGSYRGSGNVTSAVFGTESRAQIENYGEEGVSIVGVWNRFSSSINNAGANVENAVANASSLELQKGTIERASVHRLDLVNPTVQNDPDLIVADFAYLRADDTVLNFEPGTAHFIKSSVPLPSLLSGIVETNVSQEVIENASEKVVVTKEYVNAIYGKKVKTINTATVQTSATLNAAFPLVENPIGSQVVNLDLTEGYMYIRISDTSWRKFALGTAI